MASRRPISKAIETNILVNSKRRCALCFGLKGDLGEKKGQIAHLDQDRSNNLEDNLAFLCFEHHNEYDSKTSQSKGLTIGEVKFYRDKLYVEIGALLSSSTSERRKQSSQSRLHDCNIFNDSSEILSEEQLRSILRDLQGDDSYAKSNHGAVLEFCLFFEKTGNFFISAQLNSLVQALVVDLRRLLNFLGLNFFIFPECQTQGSDIRYVLCPHLNIDRGGFGKAEDDHQYFKLQNELDEICNKVLTSYSNYRMVVKQKLLM